jgi:hypothetical protein
MFEERGLLLLRVTFRLKLHVQAMLTAQMRRLCKSLLCFKGLFTDRPQPDALHTMILVGTCDTTVAIDWFFLLLLNWWSKMQFVEIRDDLLITSKGNAKIIFASYDQTEILCDDLSSHHGHIRRGGACGRTRYGRPRFLEGRN